MGMAARTPPTAPASRIFKRASILRWARARSEGIAPGEADESGPPENLDVEPERPVVDVIEVEIDAGLQLVRCIHGAATAVDLGQAGNAGLHAVAEAVLR